MEFIDINGALLLTNGVLLTRYTFQSGTFEDSCASLNWKNCLTGLTLFNMIKIKCSISELQLNVTPSTFMTRAGHRHSCRYSNTAGIARPKTGF